ncbi:unnamed protein product [Closterium sp. NIES-54]
MFTRRPGSSLYTLTAEPPQVAASAQVSSSPPALTCPALPSFSEGRQRAAPHSSSFPSTTAPLQTLHVDVWGPAHVSGRDRERYFLLVVDDYTRYTTVFPLRSKGEVHDVLIPWIRAVRLQLGERFRQDLPVLRLHSDRGGEFSSDLLQEFCRGEGILQIFTLSASQQQNGVAERRTGLVMELARTSMIHAAAPHFLWPFAVRYAAHQLNLWPHVSLPETSPTLRLTGKVGDASVFRGQLSLTFEQHLLAAETSAVAVGAARGTPCTPFFEGSSPSPLAPSYASAAAVDVLGTEDVGAASASAKRRSSKGKGGRSGGGGSGSGGGGINGGSGSSGGGGSGGSGGGIGGVGGGGGGSGWSGGSGSGGSGGGRNGGQRGGSRGGQRHVSCPYVIRTDDHAGQTCGKAHTQHRCFSRLDEAWRAEFGDEVERPHWAELLTSGVDIFDLDYDAILSAMYALSASAEGDCYRCVPPDPGIEATALSAGKSSLPGTAPAEALHTFTLDSGASCCFFCDSTTLTPLPVTIPVRLADPSGGPVVPRSSTVLPCPAVPSGSLLDLHLPSFSTNLVSTAALQDAMVTTTTPGGQRVSICTCTRMGRHLATFTRQPRSSLYTLATEPPQVAASAQVFPSVQVAAPFLCRLLSHQTLLWHHRLGHPSLPRLRGMHSHLLVSDLPRSLPPLPPLPAPPCLPCIEGRQRAAPHSSSFPPTTDPLQTLHMDQGSEVVSSPLTSCGNFVVGRAFSNRSHFHCMGRPRLHCVVRHARLRSGASGVGGAGDAGAGGAGVLAGASGTGGTAAAGPGGARTKGTGAAGTSGVGGAGAGDPTEPGATGARCWCNPTVCIRLVVRVVGVVVIRAVEVMETMLVEVLVDGVMEVMVIEVVLEVVEVEVAEVAEVEVIESPTPPPHASESPTPPPHGSLLRGLKTRLRHGMEMLVGKKKRALLMCMHLDRTHPHPPAPHAGAVLPPRAPHKAQPSKALLHACPDLQLQRPDLTSQRPDLPSQRPDLTSQRPDLPSQRPDLTSQRPDLPSQRPDLPSQRPDPLSSRSDLQLQRPDLLLPRPDLLLPRPDLLLLHPDLHISAALLVPTHNSIISGICSDANSSTLPPASPITSLPPPPPPPSPTFRSSLPPPILPAAGSAVAPAAGPAAAPAAGSAAAPAAGPAAAPAAGRAAAPAAGRAAAPAAGSAAAPAAGPAAAPVAGPAAPPAAVPSPHPPPALVSTHPRGGLQPVAPTAPTGPVPTHPGAEPSPPGDPPTFAPNVNDPQSSETAIRTYRTNLQEHLRQQLRYEDEKRIYDDAAARYSKYQKDLDTYTADLVDYTTKICLASCRSLSRAAAGVGVGVGVVVGVGVDEVDHRVAVAVVAVVRVAVRQLPFLPVSTCLATVPLRDSATKEKATCSSIVKGTVVSTIWEDSGSCAGGTGAGGAGAGGAGIGGTSAGGAGASRAGAVDPRAGGAGGTVRPRPYFVPLPQQVLGVPSSTGLTPSLLCPPLDRSQPPLLTASPLPAPSPYTEQSGSLIERCEPVSRPVLPVSIARRVPSSRPPPVPDTHAMALRLNSVPVRVPLPAPLESSLPEVPDPESDRDRAASPTVSRLLATVVTDPSFESTAASALVAELLHFGVACCLEYVTALAAESKSASPPSVKGECALGTDVLEDRQEEFECRAAVLPRFASTLLAPEGDPDAPDIPTPRSYAEAITVTYVEEVPPPGANIVDGMWIFRVKRSLGSSPSFKARYVARGFSQRQGVDYFHIFSPTPKMTTLRVLLHVAAQCGYELHSLDFSTAFLQGSLHEEIWLRRPPGFTGSTTLAALGFAPSTADPSLFLRTDTLLPPFYVIVYVDDLVFATSDTEALTLVKSEL